MTALLPLIALYLHQTVPSAWTHPAWVLLLLPTVCPIVLFCWPKRRKMLFKALICVFSLYLLLSRGAIKTTPSAAFEAQRVVALEGTLAEDSTLSRTERQVLRVRIERCRTVEGDEGSAAGIVSAIITITDPLYASSAVTLEGTFASPSLFIAKRTTVDSIGAFTLLRRRLISVLDARLDGVLGQTPSKSLAAMLLLGQSDSESFLLKDLAIACGCAHTLALSGMHLSFFLAVSTTLCTLVLGRRWGRRVALVPPILFVLLAGPKPSLVRSLLFRLAIMLPISAASASVVAFLFQLFLFPEILTSLSALYSWAAFAAVLLSSKLPRFPLRTTAVAIAATAPASLLYTGSWNAMGLLLSGPVTLLIALSMALSLALIGGGSLFASPLIALCDLMLTLLEWGASRPLVFETNAYLSYLLVLLTIVVAIGYAESTWKRQRRKRYEMGVRIRLTEGNNTALGGAGVCHDEEVWTELSALHLHPTKDSHPPVVGSGPTGP